MVRPYEYEWTGKELFDNVKDKRFYFNSGTQYLSTSASYASSYAADYPIYSAQIPASLEQGKGFSIFFSFIDLPDQVQINNGDFTGIGVLQGDYAFIAATKTNGKNQIVIATRKSEQELYKIGQVDKDEVQIIWQTQIQENKIIFRENFDFSLNADFVDFEYKNISSENWNKIDFKKKLKFGLDHFTGARIALFNYSTKIIGGKSIFSNFKFIKE
jgi:hypothetical protein